MIARFLGLDTPIHFDRDSFTTLIVENPTFYARICQSILSNMGAEAIEPYTLWDEGGDELTPRDRFLSVDPFHLPWDAKVLSNRLYDSVLECIGESDESQHIVSELYAQIRSVILNNTLQLNAAYDLGIELDIRKFLRAFGYHAVAQANGSLLDNVIEFLSYASDMEYRGVLVFINVRSLFSEKDFRTFTDHLLFLRIRGAFLENSSEWRMLAREQRIIVDEDFLELQI